jgi:DNA-binding LacI/PurR family transcriptional regulator
MSSHSASLDRKAGSHPRGQAPVDGLQATTGPGPATGPAPRGTGRMTIAAIARESGLSVATVSKVLNGRPDVSASTRARVQQLMTDRGYRPRNSFSTSNVPPLIDVVFEEFDSAWALEVVRGAMVAAQQNGLTVAVTSLSDGDERRVWVNHISTRGTRGVILLLSQLTASQRRELRSRRLPFVVIDPASDPGPDVSSVGTTNWSGGLVATRHLIELGHRRIAIVAGQSALLSSRARLDGFRAALETAGLQVHEELVRWGDFRVPGGYEQGKALLALADPPTAVFASNDQQAYGVIEAAREAGLRVPQQLSVVGFDDLPISRWFSPPLTTVRQPLDEMAALAVRVLLDAEDGNSPVTRYELATDLIVRESTAPPQAG